MADPASEAHRLAVVQAEQTYQNTINASSTAAQVRAARIIYYQAVLASGRANGVKTNASAALASLGVVVSGQPGD